MFKNPVPLSSEKHRNTRIKQSPTIEHVKDSHLASVTVHEFVACAGEYPIIFIRTESGPRAVVMWGAEPGKNVHVSDGKWQGGYVPASVRCFPFVTNIQTVDDEKRIFVGIHEESELVNDNDGERLFDDEGQETEWFKKTIDFINNVTQRDDFTNSFAKELESLGLLKNLKLSYKTPAGEERNIDGILAVEPKALAELSDEAFLKLRKANFLDAIYAHLVSLENLNKLLRKAYAQ